MTISAPTQDAVTLRLPMTYDVDLLRRDLEALKSIAQAPQPGPYHAGEWTGIALYSMGGKQTAMPSSAGLEKYKETEALQHAPYFKKLLDELKCPKEVVRILTLPPGGHIKEHYDYHTNFQYGLIRLHIPIFTHPDVEFVIAKERMAWNAGELWYGDFSKVHSVKNNSPITRVHLVMDIQINDFILNLFPADFVERRKAEGISMSRESLEASESDLRRFICDFQIPGEYLPLFLIGKKLSTMTKGAKASVRLLDGKLVTYIDDEPTFALDQISGDTFAVTGLSAGITLQLREENQQIQEVILNLKGLPKDIYFARLGFMNGPALPERNISLPLIKSLDAS